MALILAQKAEVVHARELAEVVDDPDLGVGVIVLLRLTEPIPDSARRTIFEKKP